MAPKNSTLLKYDPYIAKEWSREYFAFDELKDLYKLLKAADTALLGAVVIEFDTRFANEIIRVSKFVDAKAQTYSKDLTLVSSEWDMFDVDTQSKVLEDELDRTIQRTLQTTYQSVVKLREFYDLNRFLICKVAKKFEKVLSKRVDSGSGEVGAYIQKYRRESTVNVPLDGLDTLNWVEYPSCSVFSSSFVPLAEEVETSLSQRCVDVYSAIFRRDHRYLALGELSFIKSRDQDSKNDRFLLGLKLGLTLAIIGQIIFDSCVLQEFQFPIWKSYGLYVYTTFGNILLFKTTWAISVGIWSLNNINYISLFRVQSLLPNTVKILNETMSIWTLWAISLSIFFQANSVGSILQSETLSYMCPMSLIICSVIYYARKFLRHGHTVGSRGLFTWEVVSNCIKAPFVRVTFRDNFAADVLTSFTRVINDSIYSCIWILSGDFTHTDNDMDGNDKLPLGAVTIEIIINCVVCYVLAIRMAQCLRNYYDTGHFNPHVYNALKYASAVVVVIYGMFRGLDGVYIFLIVFATLYKWWWDVVMDWGLEALVLPYDPYKNDHAYPLLRQKLLYGRPLWYVIAIVIDLMLRFVWVFSLVPTASVDSAFGPLFSVYLGSVEILRRFMWGLIRVEWEHLKHASKEAVGYRIPSIVSEHGTLNEVLLGNRKSSAGQTAVPKEA
jgi:hypothetical protein